MNAIYFLGAAVATCFLAVNVNALSYSPSQADIASFYEVKPGDLVSAPDATGAFEVVLNSTEGTWGDVQIGRDATFERPGSAFYSGSWADLSPYESYTLGIRNASDTDWFMANIYLNTGYTDSPWSQTDRYYQADWIWVAPGASVVLALDLDAVENLQYVSGIGFKIGSNIGTGEYQGKDIKGRAMRVPDGGMTLALLGTVLAGIAALRRRRA